MHKMEDPLETTVFRHTLSAQMLVPSLLKLLPVLREASELWRWKTAYRIAQVLAWVVSMRHDVITYEQEDEADSAAVPDRAVFASPLVNLPLWRLALWNDSPKTPGDDGCVNAWVLGCDIEVFYRTRTQ